MPRKSTTIGVPRICIHCGCSFNTRPAKARAGLAIYCSMACEFAHRRISVLERFWSKVETAGPEDCWPWLGYRDSNGYGGLFVGGSSPHEYAHRFSYALAHSGIPGGAFILHSCDNPWCVNPSHLHAGTQLQNIHECMTRGRRPMEHKGGAHGEHHGSAKLTEASVAEIRHRRDSGEKLSALASDFRVSEAAISRICLRHAWKHVP